MSSVVNIIIKIKKEVQMKVDVKIFQTAKDIEKAQKILVDLENTQNSLWKKLKDKITTQIDIKPAIPADNNIHTLCYDAPNGKRLELCFNTDMENFCNTQIPYWCLYLQ